MIQLIIDSGSDLTRKEADLAGIGFVPLSVRFDEELFLDGETLSKDMFYHRLKSGKENPQTSAPSPAQFSEAFQQVADQGNEGICLSLAGGISATYQSACLAAEDFGGRIRVIDTGSASLGIQILVHEAQRLVAKGLSQNEVVQAIEAVKLRVVVYGVLSTLEYLRRGGRISSLRSAVGGLLAIKPLLRMKQGSLEMIGKARGQRNADQQFIQRIQSFAPIAPEELLYAYAGEDPGRLETFYQDELGLDPKGLVLHQLGPTIGTHVGPGTLVVAGMMNEGMEEGREG